MFPQCFLAIALAVASPEAEQLRMLVEATPACALLGDVLFVRVSVKNIAADAMRIPHGCLLEDGTLHLEMVDPEEHTTYMFVPDGCPASAGRRRVLLEPGKVHVLSLLMVPLPRLDRISYRFWKPDVWRDGGYYLRARCEALSATTARDILIRRRRPEEMAALLKSHEGGLRAPVPRGWDTYRPSLGHFYLFSFPLGTSVPEKLGEMESALSPGSLRDLVRATRLTQAVYDAKDSPARRGAAAQLLEWLDGRPEIQREWMTLRLNDLLAARYLHLGDFHADFIDEIISRLPDNYGPGNYREYVRKQYILE